MIAAWMVYALVVSLLFGLAGIALERSLRLARWPGRWAVFTAMLGSLIVPLLMRSDPPAAVVPSNDSAMRAPIAFAAEGFQQLPAALDLGTLDLPLVALWIAATFLALGLVIGTQLRVLREIHECPESLVHGIPVRRTRSFGPATVGCVKSVIVLPEWADRLDPEAQRLTLLHEREHLRAGDPQLLFVVLVLAALQPWNLALWWQLGRLKRAIELDCDRRVLASGADVRAYGNLLLQMASNRAPARAAALALSNTRAFVVRRVRTMADDAGKSSYVTATCAALCAALLVVLGCKAPSPLEDSVGDEPQAAETSTEAASDRGQAPEVQGSRVFEYRVMTEGIEEVLDVLREARGRGMLSEGGGIRADLPALMEGLREDGILQEVPPTEDPALSMLLQDSAGIPRGLIRITEMGGERQLQIFRSVGTVGGNP